MEKRAQSMSELREMFQSKKAANKEKIQGSIAAIQAEIPEVATAIQGTVTAYGEYVAAIPEIAKEAASREIQEQTDRIDAEFSKAETRAIESEQQVKTAREARSSQQERFIGKNAKRGRFFTSISQKISQMEGKKNDALAGITIKGSTTVAKVLGAIGKSDKAEHVQEEAGAKAVQQASTRTATEKMNKTAQKVWSAQDRAAGARDRGKVVTSRFENSVENARAQQERDAEENNRTAGDANLVKAVGRVGLGLRKTIGRADIGITTEVGAVVAAIWKGKKGQVKAAQKAAEKKHSEGLKTPAEVRFIQGIINRKNRAQDIISNTATQAVEMGRNGVTVARNWKNDRVSDVKGMVDTATTAVYTTVDDARRGIKSGVDYITTAAYTKTDDAKIAVEGAIQSGVETVAIEAMLAKDKVEEGALAIASAGVGAVASMAALGEMAIEGTVSGAKRIGEGVQETYTDVKMQASLGKSKGKQMVFGQIKRLKDTIMERLSEGSASIDERYAQSLEEVQTKKQAIDERQGQLEQDEART